MCKVLLKCVKVMFILGTNKRTNKQNKTKQNTKKTKQKKKKTSSTFFEIFLALLIKYVDDNNGNNNGDNHISPASHHHLQSQFVLVEKISFVFTMIILHDRYCAKHSNLAYIASFNNVLNALIGICHVKRQ